MSYFKGNKSNSPATISALAELSGGINPAGLPTPAVDPKIFKLKQ